MTDRRREQLRQFLHTYQVADRLTTRLRRLELRHLRSAAARRQYDDLCATWYDRPHRRTRQEIAAHLKHVLSLRQRLNLLASGHRTA